MNRLIIICILILSIGSVHSQTLKQQQQNYKYQQQYDRDSIIIAQYRQIEPFFREAYVQYPTIPRGILEAVAFTYTRFTHLKPSELSVDNSTIPATYGVMGLTLDGKGSFRNNLQYIAELSGISIDNIICEPRENIRAYAAAYAILQKKFHIFSQHIEEHFPILNALSELPLNDDSILHFARQSNLYSICRFIDNTLFRTKIAITLERPNYQKCFGDILPLLQSEKIEIAMPSIKTNMADYHGALWNPAGRCNYSIGRNNHTISAIALHYTQGTYAGSIAWFRNCTYNGVGSQASAHYVIRSFDGQITQMVREVDKAWHVGSCNTYTIGIEHEAYGDIVSFFTDTMYQASANLTRNICQRNNISPLRMFYRDTLDDGTILNEGLHNLGGETSCIKIKGHQHFPNQSHTDPGHYWDWNYYYKLVNNHTPITEYNNLRTGVITDNGGKNGNYANDERTLQLIHIAGADSITLSFDEFELEENYDFMWIYDGNSVFAPLIGRWNTTSPGRICSTGESILIEFRSDCATTKTGWLAHWTAHVPNNDPIPESRIRIQPTLPSNQLHYKYTWITNNTPVTFLDTDDGEIIYRFYQVIGNDGTRWTANQNSGFAYDNFDDLNTSLWSTQSGEWEIANNTLRQTMPSNASLYTPISLNANTNYLYEFTLSIPQTDTIENIAGIELIHQYVRNRKYSYKIIVLPHEHQLRIYKIQNNQETIVRTFNNISTSLDIAYNYQIIYDKTHEKIIIFRDGSYLGQYQGQTTIVSGIGQGIALTCYGAAYYDNLRVYHSRNDNILLRVSGNEDCEACYQATNGIEQCKIITTIVDDHWQFSNHTEKQLLIDYSAPETPRYIADGIRNDIDYFYEPYLFANWGIATDQNSGILEYEYGITPDTVPTTIHWLGKTIHNNIGVELPLSLHGTIYVAVRATNRAGLSSEIVFSDGCYYRGTNAPFIIRKNGISHDLTEETVNALLKQSNTSKISIFPNPASTTLHIKNHNPISYIRIINSIGQTLFNQPLMTNEKGISIDISTFPSGIYFLQLLENNGTIIRESFIKK